jgi:hypothetical protein
MPMPPYLAIPEQAHFDGPRLLNKWRGQRY